MTDLDALRIDLQELLDEVESEKELDLLVSPTSIIDRMFSKKAVGFNLPALGANVAFRPGELTVWAGMGGSGKSQLVGQVIAWAIASGEIATVASLEMPLEDTVFRMLRQVCDGKPDWGQAEAWCQAMHGRLWLYDQIDTVPVERLMSLCKVAAIKLGSTHVVIDSLTKSGISQDGDGYLSKQTSFVNSLQHIAKHLGIHVHLVVHLRKGESGARKGMHDIRGASQISDLADNVFILERNFAKERAYEQSQIIDPSRWSPELTKAVNRTENEPDAWLQIEKQRKTGWIGDIRLTYHHRSGQFIPQGRIQAMPWALADDSAVA